MENEKKSSSTLHISPNQKSKICIKQLLSNSAFKLRSDKVISLPKVSAQIRSDRTESLSECPDPNKKKKSVPDSSKDLKKRKSLLELMPNSEDDLNLLKKKSSRCAVVLDDGSKRNFELKSNEDGCLSFVLHENDTDPGDDIKSSLSKIKINVSPCIKKVETNEDEIIKQRDLNQITVLSKGDIESYASATKVTPRTLKVPVNVPLSVRNSEISYVAESVHTQAMKPIDKKLDSQKYGFCRIKYNGNETQELRERLKMKQAEKNLLNSVTVKQDKSKSRQMQQSEQNVLKPVQQEKYKRQVSFSECLTYSKTPSEGIPKQNVEKCIKKKVVDAKFKRKKKLDAMQKFIERLEKRRVYLRHNQRNQRPILHLLGKGYSKWKNRPSQNKDAITEMNVLLYKSDNLSSKVAEFIFYIQTVLKPFIRSTFDVFVCLSAIISVVADTLRF